MNTNQNAVQSAFSAVLTMLPENPHEWEELDMESVNKALAVPHTRSKIIDPDAKHQATECARTSLRNHFTILRDDLRQINATGGLFDAYYERLGRQTGRPAVQHYYRKQYHNLQTMVRQYLFRDGKILSEHMSYMEATGYVFWVEDRRLYTKLEGHVIEL